MKGETLKMKVLVYPPNSIILSDLVERAGHQPVGLMKEIASRVRDPEIDSPPYNITDEDIKRSLRFVSVEEPSGLRGRVGVMVPMLEEAEAVIIVEDAEPSFGCMGCSTANEFIKLLIRNKEMPHLDVKYPQNADEAKTMVHEIMKFLKGLDDSRSEEGSSN